MEANQKRPSAERRRSDRSELVVRVDYKTIDDLFSEFATNINEGGIFIETDSPSEIGATVSLEFKIPGSDEPIATLGRVVRTTQGDAFEPPGMGIEFGELGGDARERINQLVRSLRAEPDAG